MTNKRVMQGFGALLMALILCASTIVTTVRAAGVEYDEPFFSGNNIVWYDPRCVSGADAKFVQLAGKDNTEKILNFFMRKGLSLAQSAGIIGNMMQESGLNPAIIQGGQIADDSYTLKPGVGFGLVQWTDGGRQQRLTTTIQHLGVGITNLSGQLENTWEELNSDSYNHVLQALKGTQDPVVAAVIVHGKADSASSLPQYTEAMKMLNNQRGYEASGDSGDAVVNVRGGNAKKVYDTYSDAPALAGSTATSDMKPAGEGSDGDIQNVAMVTPTQPNSSCDSGGSFGGGDIYATVSAYAWHTYKGNDTTATQAYNDAVTKAKSQNLYVGGIRFTGIDCGGAVSRILKDSGFDKNYNSGNGNTITQKAYLDDSKNGWVHIQPGDAKITGDVAINQDHTYLYVDKTKVPKGSTPGNDQEFQENIASASLDERAPMAGTESDHDPNFTWYRKVK